MRVEPVEIETPVAPTTGVKLVSPGRSIVPILRAGLGMLDGMVRLLPTRRGGLPRHGPQRGDARADDLRQAAARRPVRPAVLRARPDARHRRHAASRPSATCVDRGADDVTAICLLAAPEGIAKHRARPSAGRRTVTLVTGAIDERLNENGYIVPGLGDAGDRLFGEILGLGRTLPEGRAECAAPVIVSWRRLRRGQAQLQLVDPVPQDLELGLVGEAALGGLAQPRATPRPGSATMASGTSRCGPCGPSTSRDGICPQRYQVRSAARDAPVSAAAFSSVTQSEPSELGARARARAPSRRAGLPSPRSPPPMPAAPAAVRSRNENHINSMVLTWL